MAISTELYLDDLNEFLGKIRQNPESAEQEKRIFMKKITKSERSKRINIVATVLEKLYNYDYNALRRDLHKVMVLRAEKVANQQERIDFLQCIKGTIDFFMQGDYSELFQYLDSMSWNEEDYENLPFM